MREIKIGRKTISGKTKPFVIAEAGVNYYDIAKKENIYPIDAAKLMIREAAKAGADAIKFQTYKAEKIASRYSPAYWDTSKEKAISQYELFKRYDKLKREDYHKLAWYAEKKKIIFLSTAFDNDAVDFLNDIMPAFKISSSDITNYPLIECIAKKKKPILLSTGASAITEIKDAMHLIQKNGDPPVIIMHCILSYPTKYENANLMMIRSLEKYFPGHYIGYSDHTAPDPEMLVLTAAVFLGARVIEKHFTLDKSLPGNDHYHSMDPFDLRKFVDNISLLQKIMGFSRKAPIATEQMSRKYARRSIVANAFIKKGTKIAENMLICKRPGTGIEPKYLGKIVGKKAKRDIKNDEILRMKDLL